MTNYKIGDRFLLEIEIDYLRQNPTYGAIEYAIRPTGPAVGRYLSACELDALPRPKREFDVGCLYWVRSQHENEWEPAEYFEGADDVGFMGLNRVYMRLSDLTVGDKIERPE